MNEKSERILFLLSTTAGWNTVGKRIANQAAQDPDKSNKVLGYTSYKWPRHFTFHTQYHEHIPFHVPLLDPHTVNYVQAMNLRNFASRFDAVVAGHLTQAAAMLGNRSKTPVFAYVDSTRHLFRTAFGDRKIPDSGLVREHKVFHQLAHIFAMSQWAADDIEEFYEVPREKISVVVPPAQESVYSPKKSETKDRKKERLDLIFVGMDFERKGGRRLLEWQRNALHEHFTIHIVTRERYVDNTVPNVVWLGEVENQKLVEEIYPSMDVLCLPTIRDCSPLVIGEAAMAGVPVVAAATGGISDLVEHDVTGLLVPTFDDVGFKKGLLALADEPKRLVAMGQNARIKALKEFAPNVIYRRIVEKVHQVLSSS